MTQQLLKALAKQGRPVTVVGDTIFDYKIDGEMTAFAQEANGCPVFTYQSSMGPTPGGAAYIAAQLAVFGADVHFVTMLDEEEEAQVVRQYLQENLGVHVSCLTNCGHVNAVKHRHYVRRGKESCLVWREDFPHTESMSPALMRLAEIQNYVQLSVRGRDPASQILVVADYAKGMFTGITGSQLNNCPHHKLIRNIRRYSAIGVSDLAIMNRQELTAVCSGMRDGCASVDVHEQIDQLFAVNEELVTLAVTDGANGILLKTTDGCAKQPLSGANYIRGGDPVGASDVLMAFSALLMAQDYEPGLPELVMAGAGAASVSGTGPVTLARILRRYAPELWTDHEALPALIQRLRCWSGSKPVIGFTNGCFDALHAGHMTFLRRARAACDLLIVGVNSDAGVRELKGPDRPLQSFEQRCAALAELGYAELIVQQTDSTPHSLLSAIKPDRLFKGYGYNAEDEAVGHEIVTANGGKVQLITEGLPGFSTTATVQAARQEIDSSNA